MVKNNLIKILNSEKRGFSDYSLIKLKNPITLEDSVEIYKYLFDNFPKLKSFYKSPSVRATNNEYGISILCSNEKKPLVISTVSTAKGNEVDFKDTYLFEYLFKPLGDSKSQLDNFKFDEIKNKKAHILDFDLSPKFRMPFLNNFPRISSLLINSSGENYEIHLSGTKSDKKLFISAMDNYFAGEGYIKK